MALTFNFIQIVAAAIPMPRATCVERRVTLTKDVSVLSLDGSVFLLHGCRCGALRDAQKHAKKGLCYGRQQMKFAAMYGCVSPRPVRVGQAAHILEQ